MRVRVAVCLTLGARVNGEKSADLIFCHFTECLFLFLPPVATFG